MRPRPKILAKIQANSTRKIHMDIMLMTMVKEASPQARRKWAIRKDGVQIRIAALP